MHQAVKELSRGALGAVCIVDKTRNIFGILTEGDVRHLFLEGSNASIPVTEVMTRSPKVVSDTAKPGEAPDLMEAGERKVYVLPVINPDNQYVGMLGMHDIVGI